GFRISVDSGEVRGNTVNGADQNGISLVGDGVVVVSDNRLSGIAQVAIDVDDHIVGYLSRNVVKGANQGIAAFGDALVVDGNSIGNVANQGIECFNPNLTTSRNRFNRCGRGILVGAFSDGCTHVENVVKRSGGNGLELEIGAADNLFRGNTVKQSRGFDLLDSSGSANGFIANSFGTVGP
ncbi:MAG TPA: right-handed parallel beta-helix repeat-containing protein, partial [Pirellulaceae bacterium]|nr:right-handed parallel beta-helix repeat-containing protein [Pirellulaceae bacterium]